MPYNRRQVVKYWLGSAQLLMRLCIVVLILTPAIVANADMDTTLIQDAKEVLFDLFYKGKYGDVAASLEGRGVPKSDYQRIAANFSRSLANCYVDNLESDSSPVSKSYLIMVAEGDTESDLGGLLRRAYTDDEMSEFSHLVEQSLRICEDLAYESLGLTP